MINRSKTKKLLTILLITAVASGLTFVGYKYFVPNEKTSQEIGQEAKKRVEAKDVERAKSPENKNYYQDGNQSQNKGNENVAVTITSSNQSGQTVFIGAIVDGATAGECQLTLTRNNNNISKTATIGLQVSYYICNGFNVDLSEFQEKGEWAAIVEAVTPSGSARSEPRKITIK